ncbi:hypothetical protein C2845_PM01G42560 [Panicum miliaceum]|uniref:Uncharacterized protein n=1 Tax=Panicum miliaceum TaxID=4540 RepID=A0A3L6TRR9_PANMI|nr:hypothetical protein C2845_PM01G42560 [Panicum miliaceum]
MAGKEIILFNSYTTDQPMVAPTPANSPNSPIMIEPEVEEVHTLSVVPLAVAPVVVHNGGPRGANPRLADPPGQPNWGRDLSRPRSMKPEGKGSGPEPLPASTKGGSDLTEVRSIEEAEGEQHARGIPRPKDQILVFTPSCAAKGKEPQQQVPPKRVRRHRSQPAAKKTGGYFDSSEEEAPQELTLAELTIIVREHRLENRRLKDQLAEWKLEVEELHDDLRTFRRGLSSRLKRLYTAIGQEDLY